MIYKFTILSDEIDNFVRVINIDSEATFFDLHTAMLDSVNFKKNLMTTFFICSDNWEKEQEVTLIEMESTSEYDNLVMDETKLDELITEEKQKLMYVFDVVSDRAFFMVLSEIIPGKTLKRAQCINSEGNPPQQILNSQDVNYASKINLDENFYGDEDYELDELDEEGFGDLNLDNSTLFSEDPKF
ncbi:MAG: hypothetical protein Q7U47_00595 [Paludibacter sp.]|nr:hypothetical protein [Paludibacter sp.]